MHIVALNPDTGEISLFKDGEFSLFTPLKHDINSVPDMMPVFDTTDSMRNIPIHIINL
jgi:hypothetical protein